MGGDFATICKLHKVISQPSMFKYMQLPCDSVPFTNLTLRNLQMKNIIFLFLSIKMKITEITACCCTHFLSVFYNICRIFKFITKTFFLIIFLLILLFLLSYRNSRVFSELKKFVTLLIN